jgi:hypothetical protein
MNKEQAINQALSLIEQKEKRLNSQKLTAIILLFLCIALSIGFLASFSKLDELEKLSTKFNDEITHEQHSLLLNIVDSKIELALAGYKMKNGYITLFIGMFLGLSISMLISLKSKRHELSVYKNVLHAINTSS